MLYAASIVSQAAAALIISSYDPLHSTRTGGRPTMVAEGEARSLSQKSCVTIKHVLVPIVTRAVRDPSPFAFIAALSLYTILALVMCHLHRRHRFQNHFLIVGACLGVMISSTRSLLLPSKGLVGEMQSILPWTVFLASLSSAVAHSYMGPEMLIDEGDADVHKWDRKTGPASLGKVNLLGMSGSMSYC